MVLRGGKGPGDDGIIPADRRQVVSVSVIGVISGKQAVKHGLPQGSLLGSLFFLVLVKQMQTNPNFCGRHSAYVQRKLMCRGMMVSKLSGDGRRKVSKSCSWWPCL